jgi:alpha-galactosidase
VDPNTASTLTPDEIVSMVDDLIEAHGDLIPEGIRRG